MSNATNQYISSDTTDSDEEKEQLEAHQHESIGINNSNETLEDNDNEVLIVTRASKKRDFVEESNVGGEATYETIEKGSMNIILSKFESLDYDPCENQLMQTENCRKSYNFVTYVNFTRWIIFFLIGVLTAFIGIFIDISIEIISDYKYFTLKKYLDQLLELSILWPTLIWLGFNIIPVLFGSLLVTYIEPVALGSGIPQVKCYLNGIKMPRIVRIKTLAVKTFGVITTVVGGLAAGKEGPMIHSGAVVAAGISQGKSTTFGKDFKILKYFREDHEKRDFVSGGAAAGVAAAFGAPVGGVLFGLEEGASFWNQSLTWRIFFASIVSTFTLNIVLSAYHGHAFDLTYTGLLNFGKFTDLRYNIYEILIFMGLGVFGGLMGALFNSLNHKLTVFRMRYMEDKWLKVLEVILVAAVSAILAMLMVYYISDCRPLTDDVKYPVQMFCADNQYNTLGKLWLQVPEKSVKTLFHDPVGEYSLLTLLCFVVSYYFLSIWTYGLSVSGGLFIPCLVIGSAWGRLFSVCLQAMLPTADWIDPGKYALIGAAAQLGGVVRMTISLTIILIEATGNISFGLPLMVTLITAKWTGDLFTEGLYDIHIQLSGIPLLAWEPPPLSSNITAKVVQSHPVVCLKRIESVRNVLRVLTTTSHNGFPVVETETGSMSSSSRDSKSRGSRLVGLILRSQLIILIKNEIYKENQNATEKITEDLFRNEYPRYPSVRELYVSEENLEFSIQLDLFMNLSPFSVQEVISLPRVFKLFRALGLRHVVVVNQENSVVGIITRKDLARYRVSKHAGRLGVEELKVLD